MILRAILALLLLAPPLRAEVFTYPGGDQVLTIYSSLDNHMAAPLIAGFQAENPDVTVAYQELLTGELNDRIVAETDAGRPTADFAFSSAMDLQVKLANDGYARPAITPDSAGWPRWANWRDTAYALTFEPAVLIYYRPAFRDRPPPASRFDLMDWLARGGAAVRGRIGTYDIERSAVGYLFLARDQEHFPDIWGVIDAMGRAGVQQFSTSQQILERVADGRLLIGYNILGSYAADWARDHPDVGMVLPRDFTVVVSRVGLVPRAAARPDLGARFLGFFMSRAGQTILAEKLRLPAVSLEVSGDNSARTMQAALGAQLRPVTVSPGLLVYLDQAKRARLIDRWRRAVGGG
ncbi:ABC transporter substrate-binding protein [Paracoccus sediminis]|uniref:ABC transporter substrate-binding protein n=1 Tax=Paracoccus sediminis TaxID=1214787 RepID=A0A238WM74_9RHOB|nr:ABC transporter substrate-binding protein [Paracoccus sediminis]TBN50497.1 ABC transporter substrate-binding protein [Paracoccus sediminis]SNR47344.1 iron(III) transport system substrate-binding protein [Paracoccus sediminis]